jgi:hypothetical protein
MDYLLVYALFALTTAIAAHYELVWPVIRKEGLDTETIVPNKFLLSVTFLGINFLAAPVVFLSCIIPDWSMRFRETLQTALFPKE